MAQQRIDKQHARGKLTARERFALLFDTGSISNRNARHADGNVRGRGRHRQTPADAVICAFGKVDGESPARQPTTSR